MASEHQRLVYCVVQCDIFLRGARRHGILRKVGEQEEEGNPGFSRLADG